MNDTPTAQDDIREVECFETSDGRLHHTMEDAFRAQSRINIRKRLDDDPLLGNYEGSRVEFDQLVDWMRQNSDVVLDLLSDELVARDNQPRLEAPKGGKG